MIQGREEGTNNTKDLVTNEKGELLVEVTNPGGGGGGDASAANQLLEISLLEDIKANTASIQITADSVNLNTDNLETLVAEAHAVAGSDATKAVSVQGITDGKAIPVSLSTVPLATGAATNTGIANGKTLSDIWTLLGTPSQEGGVVKYAPHQLSRFGENIFAEITPVQHEDYIHGFLSRHSVIATIGAASSVTVETRQAKMVVGSALNDYAVQYHAKAIRYRAYESIDFGETIVFGALSTTNEKLVGLANFSTSSPQTLIDFIGFGNYIGTDSTSTTYTGSQFGILHINSASGSAVTTFYPSSTFAYDISGIDLTKGFPFAIQYPWQGYGDIDFTLNIGGEIKLLKRINVSGQTNVPSLSTPNLRRYHRVRNAVGGSEANNTIKFASSGAKIHGKKRYTSVPRHLVHSRGVAGGVYEMIFAIQCPKTLNGVDVTGYLEFLGGEMAGGAGLGDGYLVLNPTFPTTQPVWELLSTESYPVTNDAVLTGTTGNYAVNAATAGSYARNPVIWSKGGTGASDITDLTGGTVVGGCSIPPGGSGKIIMTLNESFENLAILPGDVLAFVGKVASNSSINANIQLSVEI